MTKLKSIQDTKFVKHGKSIVNYSCTICIAPSLKLAIVKCDCETEEGNMANNMLTNNTVESGGKGIVSLSLSLSFCFFSSI